MTDTVLPKSLGARLHRLRKKTNLSLKIAARALGISVKRLQDIETNRVHPSEELLIEIGELLGASPFALFDDLFELPAMEVLELVWQQEPGIYFDLLKRIEKLDLKARSLTFGTFLEIFEGLEGRGRKDRLH
jgi:transcriptional regulator with XRE-family HTH domain